MAHSPHIADVTERDFDAQVIQRSHTVPVLVDFWATWCAPCQTLMPLLARLADEYQGKFFLAKVNTDKEQKLAAQHGIRSLPTVKLFRNGSAVDGFMGAQPERAVRALLDKYATSESETLIDDAVRAQQAGDTPRRWRCCNRRWPPIRPATARSSRSPGCRWRSRAWPRPSRRSPRSRRRRATSPRPWRCGPAWNSRGSPKPARRCRNWNKPYPPTRPTPRRAIA